MAGARRAHTLGAPQATATALIVLLGCSRLAAAAGSIWDLPGAGDIAGALGRQVAPGGAAPSGRRLQQTFDINGQLGDDFTFDGFPFGEGGVLPLNFGGGFGVLAYTVLFRDYLNDQTVSGIGSLIPDDINLVQYLPEPIRDVLNRDVVALFGYDAPDRFAERFITPATAEVGDVVNAACAGPVYTLSVDGGACTIARNGTVTCTQPSIVFSFTPLTCNLPYKEACSLEGSTFRIDQSFGSERDGTIGPDAGVYNFGVSQNITNLFLGYSTDVARVLNNFGVNRWYQFLVNYIVLQFTRISDAIIDGTGPLFEDGDDGGDAETASLRAAGGDGAVDDGAASPIQKGLRKLTAAGEQLAASLSQRLGLEPSDVAAALSSGGGVSSLLRGGGGSQRRRVAGSASSPATVTSAPGAPRSGGGAPTRRSRAEQRTAAGDAQQAAKRYQTEVQAAQLAAQASGQESASTSGVKGLNVQTVSSGSVEGDASLLGQLQQGTLDPAAVLP